jgi:hypothetical protein
MQALLFVIGMQDARFTVNKPSGGERFRIRLKQRAEALRSIAQFGECPGIVPWPLNQQIEGFGPNPLLCPYCDLYVDCPILNNLPKAVPKK